MNWDLVRAVAFSLFIVYAAATVLGGFVRRDGNGVVWIGDNFIKAVAAGVLTLIAYIAVK